MTRKNPSLVRGFRVMGNIFDYWWQWTDDGFPRVPDIGNKAR